MQAGLVGGVHGFGVVSPSGNVGGSPAFDQLIARLDERTPDHDCPCESAEKKNSIEIRGGEALCVSFTSGLREELHVVVQAVNGRRAALDTEVHFILSKGL